MKIRAAILILLLTSTASAAPVTWTLTGAFSGSEPLTGSFTYDADTNAFSAISIISQDPPEVPDPPLLTFYNNLFGLQPNGPTQMFVIEDPVYAGGRVLALSFTGPMTNAGGTLSLAGSLEDITGSLDFRAVTGSVSAVPIPAAAWLFGSALAGLGLIRRRNLH